MSDQIVQMEPAIPLSVQFAENLANHLRGVAIGPQPQRFRPIADNMDSLFTDPDEVERESMAESENRARERHRERRNAQAKVYRERKAAAHDLLVKQLQVQHQMIVALTQEVKNMRTEIDLNKRMASATHSDLGQAINLIATTHQAVHLNQLKLDTLIATADVLVKTIDTFT